MLTCNSRKIQGDFLETIGVLLTLRSSSRYTVLMSDWNKTYQTLQTSLGWYDLSREEEIYQLSGPAHTEFLNQYNTQEVLTMVPGEVRLGCFLTQKGKLVAPALILKQSDNILLFLPEGCGETLLKHLGVYLNFSECHLDQVSDQYIHGVLLGEGAKVAVQTQELDQATTWQTDRFGFPHREILLPKAEQKLWNKKLESLEVLPLERAFLEALRVEAGLPRWGVDMNENNLVAEVGLDRRATSFNKGCYLGQETTARVNTQGHTNQKLQRLRLQKPIILSQPLDLLQEGEKVGRLTSLSKSPETGETLGLGLIHRKAQQKQTPLYIVTQGEKILAEVISL